MNPSPIIYQNDEADDPDNYYLKNYTSALGSEISLEAGRYYYMELYHTNEDDKGFIKISV